MSYLAADKWARLLRIIKQNGGITSTLYKLWRFDTLKEGKLVGFDANGNRYWENPEYMIGRSRWVEHSDRYKWDYDASQVTAEWFGWLHYKTDCLPCQDPAKYPLNCCCRCQSWLQPHQENWSGTPWAYYPYSTVKPRIQAWEGRSTTRRPRNNK